MINAGISGYDPIKSCDLYYNLSKDIDADYTILSINRNDILDIIYRGGTKIRNKNNKILSLQPAGYYWYSWSYIVRLVCNSVFKYPELFMNNKDFANQERQACQIIFAEISALNKAIKTNNGQLIIISFPDHLECVNIGYSSADYSQLIDDLKLNKDIFVIDFIDFFKVNKTSFTIPKNQLYWPIDGHMTPLGYRLWAEIVYTNLFDNNIL